MTPVQGEREIKAACYRVDWSSSEPAGPLLIAAMKAEIADLRAALAAPVQPVAVPDGWQVTRNSEGTIVVQKDDIGGVALGPKYSRDEIAESIFEAFLTDLLAASPAQPAVKADEQARDAAIARTAELLDLANKGMWSIPGEPSEKLNKAQRAAYHAVHTHILGAIGALSKVAAPQQPDGAGGV